MEAGPRSCSIASAEVRSGAGGSDIACPLSSERPLFPFPGQVRQRSALPLSGCWSDSTHEVYMSRFSEHPTTFLNRRSGGFELTAQEQATIFAAREILARHINRNPVLSSWQAVMDYCAISVRGEVERFHVLYLDRKNRLISDERLGMGTVDHVPVYPREVVRRALDLNATALILVQQSSVGRPGAVGGGHRYGRRR